MTTIREALLETRRVLGQAGDAHPDVSAEWLVGWVSGRSRAELFADGDEELDLADRFKLMAATARRAAGEPLQYITGAAAFRTIEVACEPGVLIPRPETELLVELALEAVDATSRGGDLRVLEIGTGTGCIALSIARERPEARVVATDLAPEAVALARRNASDLGLSERVEVLEGDLADPVPEELVGTFDLLISNPPYVPSAVVDGLDAEVRDHEPRLALDGGADGLDVFRRILELAPRVLRPGGILAVELFEDHMDEARGLALEQGIWESVEVHEDLTGRPRHLVARLIDDEGAHPASGEGARPADDGDARLGNGKGARPTSDKGDHLAGNRGAHLARGKGARGTRLVCDEGDRPASDEAPRLAGGNGPHVIECDVRNPAAETIDRTIDVLEAGGVVVLPTDSVYGIGCLAFVDEAGIPSPGLARTFELKRRDPAQTLPLLIADPEDLDRWGREVALRARELAETHWPGALTLVVNASSEVPAAYRAADGTVALRVPDCPLVRDLARRAGRPLAVTSANLHDEPPARGVAELDPLLRDGADLVLDGGPAPIGVASTVVDATGPTPRVLRQGALELPVPSDEG